MATASGLGAIAVVRISGPAARQIGTTVGVFPRGAPPDRSAVFSRIRNPSGEVVDDGLFTFFKGPHSFTGEDSLEISCHGGYASVRAVLMAVLKAGARPAEPGEFTKRAFLNGKIDLAQAEGVNQLIRARTDVQRSAAQHTLDGALSHRIKQASASLTRIAAALEASIDFPEDVDEPDRGSLALELQSTAEQSRQTLELASRGKLLASGIRVAIVGRPNVGKSSLLNLLAGRARAIVSDIPGTTRDFLEESVEIGGLPVLAIDTAGIRETLDPVEQEGTRRASEALIQADVGLIVVDSTVGLANEDREVLDSAGSKAVLVWNKIDLVSIRPTDSPVPDSPHACISALTGEGLADLENAILERLGAGAGYFEEALAASARQVGALQQALDNTLGAIASVQSERELDLAAVQIQAARERLGEVTGENALDTLIDTIFSSFCIGK